MSNIEEEAPWLTGPRILSSDLYFPKFEPDECRQLLTRIYDEITKERPADPTRLLSVASLYFHSERGAQLWISKEVSQDLLISDIEEPDFASLRWPSNSLEFVFEDRRIPSFLLTNEGDGRDLEGRIEELIQKSCKGACTNCIVLVMNSTRKERRAAAGVFSPDGMNNLASGRLDDFVCETAKEFMSGHPLSDTDESVIIGMTIKKIALLAFKILMFAMSEGHSPIKTLAVPTRAQGGKPGFNGRPKTDRLIVQYLPRQITERVASAVAESRKKAFLGRRGFFRHYQHECFKNKQGQYQFIEPVPGPDGSVPRRVFKVRKPIS